MRRIKIRLQIERWRQKVNRVEIEKQTHRQTRYPDKRGKGTENQSKKRKVENGVLKKGKTTLKNTTGTSKNRKRINNVISSTLSEKDPRIDFVVVVVRTQKIML